MIDGYTIRRAAAADLGTLVEHRRAMFYDMGHTDVEALDRMSSAFEIWLLRKMEASEYLAWVAESRDGSVAGGLGMWLMDWLPHLIGPGAPRANIVNVYTRPADRRRGIARALMTTAVEWCRDKGIRAVVLHASEHGRPLYVSLGFQPTNEMRLLL